MIDLGRVDLEPRLEPSAAYTPVAVHMARGVVVRSVDCTPAAALRAMLESGQRHLVVVDPDGALVGVVSAVAVAASCGPTLEGLASRPPVHLSRRSSLHKAASLMMTQSVEAAAVLDQDGVVVGILTWSDIAAAGRLRDVP